MKNEIGQIIADARKKKKLSQEELAGKLHVSRQTVSSWEIGRSYPNTNMIFTLCKILDIDIIDMIQDEEGLINLVNKEKKKSNRLHLTFIIILSTAIMLLFCFTMIIIHSNKMNVYEVNIDSKIFSLEDSILILSKTDNYFNFGTLISKDDSLDYYIKMYELEKGEKKILFEQFYDNNIVIHEKYGYNEYFNSLDINKDLFLDISYLENTEVRTITCKILLKEIIKSDALIYIKSLAIGNGDENKKTLGRDIPIENLQKNGYKLDYEWNHIKNISNRESFSYNMLSKSLSYGNKENNNNINAHYDLNNSKISVSSYNNLTEDFNFSFDYFTNTKKLICLYGNCDNYKKYIKLMENELKKLEMLQNLS